MNYLLYCTHGIILIPQVGTPEGKCKIAFGNWKALLIMNIIIFGLWLEWQVTFPDSLFTPHHWYSCHFSAKNSIPNWRSKGEVVGIFVVVSPTKTVTKVMFNPFPSKKTLLDNVTPLVRSWNLNLWLANALTQSKTQYWPQLLADWLTTHTGGSLVSMQIALRGHPTSHMTC